MSSLRSTVQLAHSWLENYIQSGSTVVDATVGKGQDTLYLARKVGPKGRVYGFDIQEKALQAARELLEKSGFSETIQLFLTGHENMGNHIQDKVDAIIFNLGYLPGGDHSIVTRPETTIKAVQEGLSLLKQGGALCLVLYTGHSGGDEEQSQLEHFLEELDKKSFCVAKLDFLNMNKAPYIILIEKS